jgi:hypothetical protein
MLSTGDVLARSFALSEKEESQLSSFARQYAPFPLLPPSLPPSPHTHPVCPTCVARKGSPARRPKQVVLPTRTSSQTQRRGDAEASSPHTHRHHQHHHHHASDSLGGDASLADMVKDIARSVHRQQSVLEDTN